MPLSNPRHLLLLSPSSHSPNLVPPFLHSLTGSPVDPPTASTSESTSFAGYTTHPPFRIANKYYEAKIPIWVDEVGFGGETDQKDTERGVERGSEAEPETERGTAPSSAWKTEFLSQEAAVVRDAIGAIVICVSNPNPDSLPTPGLPSGNAGSEGKDPSARDDVVAIKDFVRDIADVKARIDEERDSLGEVVGLVVFVGRAPLRAVSTGTANDEDDLSNDLSNDPGGDEPLSAAWWEDQLSEIGVFDFEVVSWDPRVESTGRNQFGELQGMARIKEVLETHDWASAPAPDGDVLEEQLLGLDEGEGFDLEVNELEREMLGLRMAIERGGDESEEKGDEDRVDAMENLMLRVQGIKDTSAEMPESERKRFAARAVRDIMKDI